MPALAVLARERVGTAQPRRLLSDGVVKFVCARETVKNRRQEKTARPADYPQQDMLVTALCPTPCAPPDFSIGSDFAPPLSGRRFCIDFDLFALGAKPVLRELRPAIRGLEN
jgi:hypothetical protein